MLNHNPRYDIRCLLLALMLLISACGSAQTPEADNQSSEGSGVDTEVAAEPPVDQSLVDQSLVDQGRVGQDGSQVSEEDAAKAAEIALKEEETGVADLREFVDEIAPEPEISASTSSGVSESGLQKEASAAANDKATDAGSSDIQSSPAFMVALATGGLKTVDVQTGSTLDILFDVDREIAVSTLSTAFGEPTEVLKTNECPAGPLEITTWSNGFSLNTLEETFVGWSVRPNSESETLTTIAGVGMGTSLQNLQDAYDVEVFESSLGTEFNVGQMSGILSADQPDGQIINLWAGLNCIFR